MPLAGAPVAATGGTNKFSKPVPALQVADLV